MVVSVTGAQPSGASIQVQAGSLRPAIGRLGAGLAIACSVVWLTGCSKAPSLNPVDWWHNAQGGRIAEDRPDPPGADDPYPNLSTVPARPTPPDRDAMKKLTDALVGDRTNARYAAEAAPLADPSSPARHRTCSARAPCRLHHRPVRRAPRRPPARPCPRHPRHRHPPLRRREHRLRPCKARRWMRRLLLWHQSRRSRTCPPPRRHPRYRRPRSVPLRPRKRRRFRPPNSRRRPSRRGCCRRCQPSRPPAPALRRLLRHHHRPRSARFHPRHRPVRR